MRCASLARRATGSGRPSPGRLLGASSPRRFRKRAPHAVYDSERSHSVGARPKRGRQGGHRACGGRRRRAGSEESVDAASREKGVAAKKARCAFGVSPGAKALRPHDRSQCCTRHPSRGYRHPCHPQRDESLKSIRRSERVRGGTRGVAAPKTAAASRGEGPSPWRSSRRLYGCELVVAAPEDDVQRGHHEQGEQRRRDQSADDDGGERSLHFGTGAARQRHWDEA